MIKADFSDLLHLRKLNHEYTPRKIQYLYFLCFNVHRIDGINSTSFTRKFFCGFRRV